MELKDSTKKYLVDQIQEYYTNETDLAAIFALYKNAFGPNLYGNIVGDRFNTRIQYLVVELSKDSGTKLEKFIEITKEKYPDFAKNFNFAKESRKQRNLFVFIVKLFQSISYTLQTVDYVLRKTWLFIKKFWFFPLLIITFLRCNTYLEYPFGNLLVTETPITIVPSVPPQDFVKNYFSDIQKGKYQKAYDSLSLGYKERGDRTYIDYVNWWGKDVEEVHIESIDVISKNTISAKVDVDLRLFMRKTKKITFSNIILSLIWDDQNDKWLIDKSEQGSKGVRNQS